ncbi:hypothetical protein HYV70_04535 [Candidatus Uhrbacteria bacterium]|nr:hypothetical protein [Candidatus Uhrbacteria bacterium]
MKGEFSHESTHESVLSKERKESSVFLTHKEMYQLSGDPELTQRDLERYEDSNNELIDVLPKVITGIFENEDPFVGLSVADLIPETPKKDQKALREQLLTLVEKGLNKEDGISSCRRAIELIDRVPEKEQESLKRKAASIIKEWMSDEDPFVRINGLKLIPKLLETDRTPLIQQGLMDENLTIRLSAVEFISLAAQEQQDEMKQKSVSIIEEGLKDDDRYFFESALRLIVQAPMQDQERLREEVTSRIRKVLENTDGLFDQKEYTIQLIPQAAKKDQESLRHIVTGFVQRGMDEISINGIKRAMMLIPEAGKKDQERLKNQAKMKIQQWIDKTPYSICRHGFALIPLLPKEDQEPFFNQAVFLIKQELNDEDFFVRLEAVEDFNLIPQPYQERLKAQVLSILEEGFAHKENFIQRQTFDLIPQVPQKDRESFRRFFPLRLKKIAVQTPLYNHYPESFFHKAFRKTGSGTTLLDKVPGSQQETLKNRVIIRHIDALPYFFWKKVYEDAEFWKEKGFDYVPVEPIVKASYNEKTKKFDVATRVLVGPSVRMWKRETSLYTEFIDGQVQKIQYLLEELGVEHGHIHEGNFIVYFDRDEQGEPLLDKPPRVYVIDFDMAVSSGK